MKNVLLVLAVLISALRLAAQTNAPVRLALVSETDETFAAADVLTAELSGHKNVQLLERNEIEKVYREQGSSAANKDYLKLGQILGADGLLLLDVVRTPQTTNLMARLIAVKPGVILTDGSFAWPLKDTAQWAESVSSYLDLLLPKLSVQAKDAIPISVVNLRSAVASADGAETERQLKLLVIQRLSQEKELFVLERQKMQLLSEEKELKADDSAFWNGGYLLEGVVDQNGYSKDTITINARLTPPKGGAPLLIEVNGSRTNFAEVINQLADNVNKALKVNSSVPEWNAADEATQYFAEAQWALRWGAYSEAQAAADSAWALGRRDDTAAMLRVRAYMVSPDAGKTVIYYPPKERPDSQNIDFALRALEIYNESSRNLPPEEPKVDSDWYRLGLENLTVASRVLQVFLWSPEFYQPVAEKLTALRAAARSAAEWISRSPSVHDSYFVGERVVPYDDLYHFEENPSIFSVQLDCGCLWQETPEDCLKLYRELMSSQVFCYLHDRFWFRDGNHRSALRLLPSRLIAWNESDQKRIPVVWDKFIRELNGSTNVLLQLEAKAICLADSTNETEMGGAFTNFFSTVFVNRDALVADSVDVLYLEWRTGDLVERMGGDIVTPTKESLQQRYNSEYRPKLEAMHQEYQNKTIPARQTALAFEKQKQYLASFTPYDFQNFQQTFASRTFTKPQAAELLPLIAAYKSNLVAQASTMPQKFKAQSDAQWIAVSLERGVNEILNPPAPIPQPPVQPQAPKPPIVAQVTVVSPVSNRAPEIVTNIITGSQFIKVPLESLYALEGDEQVENSSAKITAHHWQAGKLLLDLQYDIEIVLRDGKGGYLNIRKESGPAIAIFDPATEHWETLHCPEANFETQSRFYHRSTLLRGQLFNGDGGQIKRYDSTGRQWKVLPVSDGVNYELFTVNDCLYAANASMIFEIMSDGKSTRLLASRRRQPPASALDAEDWGTPILFEGPGHSLRVCTKSKIFTWTGGDWREEGAAPENSARPEIFTDGLLFRQEGFVAAGYQNGVIFRRADGTYGNLGDQDDISILATDDKTARLCLEGSHARRGIASPGAPPVQGPKTFWKMPANLLPRLPAALRQADLLILEDDFAVHTLINEHREILKETVTAPENYNAALLCFSHDFPLPQKIFLNFDAPGEKTFAWMLFSTNLLFTGAEDANRMLGMPFGHGTGFWIVPLSQLDPAIAAQKQNQMAQRDRAVAQASAAAEQTKNDLMAKYDRNHNGSIDQDEKEAALDDPAFIESALDLIDTNHNGWLDAKELVYFDANNNKTLEPKEQAGIEIAQHLLAERLLKKFDANGDGALDRSEFNDLMQSGPNANTRPMPGFPVLSTDENHDGKIDQAELEVFLKQKLRQELRPQGAMGAAYFRQMIAEPGKKTDASQSFKAYVELFWQNSSGITNKPPDHKTE
jgi:Ca2+-binding EF-hand superfamily protein